MASTALHQDTKNVPSLYVGIDLSKRKWQLAITDGRPARKSSGPRIRARCHEAGDLEKIAEELQRSKVFFCLPEDAPVLSCYEAGPESFSVHRMLEGIGLTNLVIDPSSIKVDRRAKKAKTDRLDAKALVMLLLQREARDLQAMRVVVVPSEEAEDARVPIRERDFLVGLRTAIQNRCRSLLTTQGTAMDIGSGDPAAVLRWDEQPLLPAMSATISRHQQLYVFLTTQLEELEASMEGPSPVEQAAEVPPAMTPESPPPEDQPAREPQSAVPSNDSVEEPPLTLEQKIRVQQERLRQIKGIGPVTAWVIARELGWRIFSNVKQVGSYAGLTPTPQASGTTHRELGISKAGNPLLRKTMIEIAWTWPRNQGDSKLAQSYKTGQEAGPNKQRLKRIAVVALARKLVGKLWKYAVGGPLPDDWRLKTKPPRMKTRRPKSG